MFGIDLHLDLFDCKLCYLESAFSFTFPNSEAVTLGLAAISIRKIAAYLQRTGGLMWDFIPKSKSQNLLDRLAEDDLLSQIIEERKLGHIDEVAMELALLEAEGHGDKANALYSKYRKRRIEDENSLKTAAYEHAKKREASLKETERQEEERSRQIQRQEEERLRQIQRQEEERLTQIERLEATKPFAIFIIIPLVTLLILLVVFQLTFGRWIV